MVETQHAARRLMIAASFTVTAIIASPAYAFELSDGTYVAKFPALENACGTLKITGKGKKVMYTAGACGGAADYRHSGSFDGQTISVQAAQLELSGASAKKISGRWTLQNYTAKLNFNRQ